jgi:hypothetical protein
MLVEVLAASASPLYETLAQAVGLDATREALTLAHAHQACSRPGERLADLAALLHRLAPGIRLM